MKAAFKHLTSYIICILNRIAILLEALNMKWLSSNRFLNSIFLSSENLHIEQFALALAFSEWYRMSKKLQICVFYICQTAVKNSFKLYPTCIEI